LFSVRQLPWHSEGTILADYPGTWDEARLLAGLDWDPITTEVYALTDLNPDGTPCYEPISGWKSIARSDNGTVLSINKHTYTVIDHGEMGEIVEGRDLRLTSGARPWPSFAVRWCTRSARSLITSWKVGRVVPGSALVDWHAACRARIPASDRERPGETVACGRWRPGLRAVHGVIS
jgi:hypothetical protein